MNPVARLIAALQRNFPVNRVIALLGVFVFTPVAAAGLAWLRQHFPGLPAPSETQLVAAMGIGGTVALTTLYKFLANWGEHEHRKFASVAEALERAHALEMLGVEVRGRERVAALEGGSAHPGDGLEPDVGPFPRPVPTQAPPPPPTAA